MRGWLILAFFAPGLLNSGPPTFSDVTASSGLNFRNHASLTSEKYLIESMTGGVALFDYDGDGLLDVFLVNGAALADPMPAGRHPDKSDPRYWNRLYRNLGNFRFTDVTEKAGVQGHSYGMGAAVGDYNNDGRPDLYVTNFGRNILYRNNGDGTFSDVTQKAGLAIGGWTTSAVWFDYDNDGFLDLFVCSFVEFSLKNNVFCGDNRLGRKYYCIPRVFKPTPSLLFHNNRDGTFTEVSRGTDIARAFGKALGVVATDINNDGRMDLFVANDTVQNFLFINRGKNQWEELALAAEVGFSANGQARSGMGVDAADFDNDGWEDLFVANVDQEMFSLYRNNGDETFRDDAHAHGIAQATRLLSGWGLKFFDFDNDGLIDLFLANGHPDDMIEMYSTQVKYKEPLLLFRHEGDRLRNISHEAGPVFEKMFPARGLAVGDYNNDGRMDVLVGNNGMAPLLLKNNAGAGNHWVGLRLQGTTCNRDAIGARITWSVGGVKRSRLKNSGGSYLSSHDPREVIGLGQAAKLDWLEIRWPLPSRRVDRFTDVPADRYVTIIEGKGIAG